MRTIYKRYDDCEGIRFNKKGGTYVNNKVLLEEILKSKEQNNLTDNAVKLLVKLVENISMNYVYRCEEDREDCIDGAVLDCLTYWRGFDPEKSSNPFAYFYSVIVNGFNKTWHKLGLKNFPVSKMVSLDNENVHSL